MQSTNQYDDGVFDDNLRKAAPRIALPAAPTAEQQAAWRPPTAERDGAAGLRLTRRRTGADFMRKHRFLTWTGAVSAVAALVVIAVVLSTPSRRSTVEARTIFAGLRQAMTNGFRITLSDIQSEGVRVGGEIVAYTTSDDQADETEGLYIDAAVAGLDGGESAGLDLAATVNLAPQNNWIFVRFAGLPEEEAEAGAFLRFLGALGGEGLLLDMPDDMAHDDDDDATPPDAAAPGAGHGTLHLGISAGASSGDNAPDAQHGGAHFRATISTGAASEDGDAENHAGTPQLDALVDRLIEGRASSQDFQDLATALEDAAEEVTVEQIAAGEYLLTAHRLILPDQPPPPAGQPAPVLRIAYSESTGVQWAELQHFGDVGGSMRFERVDVSSDDPRFDRARFASRPGVRRIDIAAIGGFLQSLSGAGGGDNP